MITRWFSQLKNAKNGFASTSYHRKHAIRLFRAEFPKQLPCGRRARYDRGGCKAFVEIWEALRELVQSRTKIPDPSGLVAQLYSAALEEWAGRLGVEARSSTSLCWSTKPPLSTTSLSLLLFALRRHPLPSHRTSASIETLSLKR